MPDKVKIGWNKDSKGYYYIIDEKNETRFKLKDGWQKIHQKWFIFDEEGYAFQNKWYKDSSNSWYYLNNECEMVKSKWIYSSKTNDWYYVKDTGEMLFNCWFEYQNNYYYLKSTGECAVLEWIEDNNKTYYINNKGIMVKNSTLKINEKEYSFDESGALIITK